MSLDGYVTARHANQEHGLGIGGEAIHAWVLEEPRSPVDEAVLAHSFEETWAVLARSSVSSCRPSSSLSSCPRDEDQQGVYRRVVPVWAVGQATRQRDVYRVASRAVGLWGLGPVPVLRLRVLVRQPPGRRSPRPASCAWPTLRPWPAAS